MVAWLVRQTRCRPLQIPKARVMTVLLLRTPYSMDNNSRFEMV